MNYQFGQFRVDTTSFEVWCDDVQLKAQPQVLELLIMLIENHGKTVTRDEIFEQIWKNRVVSETTLSSRIKSIRKLLGDDGVQQKFIKTVHGRGFQFVADVSVAEENSSNTSEKIPVAVLPFNNMSQDAGQEYFADGVVEDIITALSRFHDLSVSARNSSFVYRGESVDIRQVGIDLDVRYVLEGSIRIADNQVRVTAQLVETESGTHIWAESYDRDFKDMFQVQDEVTSLIASTVDQQIRVAEIRAALNRGQQESSVRDMVIKGQWHMDQMTKPDFIKARFLVESAMQRDPEHVAAYSLLAFVSIMEAVYGWGDRSPIEAITEAEAAALAATKIDPDDESARSYLACIQWMSGNHDAAIAECETVIQFNQNFAPAIGFKGIVHAFSGAKHYQDAVDCLDKAIQLSANHPWLQFYLCHRGVAEFFSGNYETAIEWFDKSIQRNPDLSSPKRFKASACALMGDIGAASEIVDEVIRDEPGYSVATFTPRIKHLFRNEKDFELVAQGLRLGGVPEE